jgi:SsrA-binding protein
LKRPDDRNLATNRKAGHDYILGEHFEAGLVLKGSEIKSMRAGQISLKEAYIRVESGEAWLVNAHVAPYDPASGTNHDPLRRRKLLLHRRQIMQLEEAVRQKGTALIPVRLYLKAGRAKLELAIARGKRQYDKRRAIAQRDAERDMARALSQRGRR